MASVTAGARSGVFAAVDPDPQLGAALALLGLVQGQDHVQRFEPQGMSWVRRSGSSWAALHTWPEQALVTVDTYGPAARPVAALAELGWRPADRPLEFTVGWEAGRRLRYRLSRVLERRATTAGPLVLGESTDLGLALFLARRLVLCGRDSEAWHQALALPALSAHEAPGRVWIRSIGTGGLAAVALATAGVQEVFLEARSAQVLGLARAGLAAWSGGALADPRLVLGAPPDGRCDVLISDETLAEAVPGAEVVGQVGTGGGTHAVALEGAGVRVDLHVSRAPRPGRHGLAQGHWDRLVAQGR